MSDRWGCTVVAPVAQVQARVRDQDQDGGVSADGGGRWGNVRSARAVQAV